MPHSNYSKISDLLTELAEAESPPDIFDFAEAIRDKEIESFAIWRPGSEPGAAPIKTYCSTTAIRRLIRFVSELGFVEIGEDRTCRLTARGRNALRQDDYPRILATHVAIYLKERAGITLTEIKNTITAVRRPEVPFFEVIYGRISAERDLQITARRLRMVLYLLERCGMLVTVTKKIYFAPDVPAHSG